MSSKTISPDTPPLHLEKIETSSPAMVLHSFFGSHDLLKTRALLWQLFRHTVTGSFAACTAEEKKELADFYEHVQKLIEAAHIISVHSLRQHLR